MSLKKDGAFGDAWKKIGDENSASISCHTTDSASASGTSGYVHISPSSIPVHPEKVESICPRCGMRFVTDRPVLCPCGGERAVPYIPYVPYYPQWPYRPAYDPCWPSWHPNVWYMYTSTNPAPMSSNNTLICSGVSSSD